MNDTAMPIQRATYEIELNNEKEFKYYDRLHSEKYRDENQTFQEHAEQLANNLASSSGHKEDILSAILAYRFLPAGRIQAALGATEREVSPFNCSVSQTIDDSMTSIMSALSNAAKILRLGTGIGYNFSNLRPKDAEIVKLKTKSSGPLSFMKIFDVMASTVASAGHRRGAQMGIMNIDHPDIEAFIDAKMEKDAYRQFNFSVGITDAFMKAVKENSDWNLQFKGKIYKTLRAKDLWDKMVRNAYNSAEPGVLFTDRWNQKNNLWYCETISACNPCSEQCLPPYGLCTLGSFNLVAYLRQGQRGLEFNYDLLTSDIKTFVEAYDNVFEDANYAIPEHREEALNKRRIGLGYTGIANAIELVLGKACYGSDEFCKVLHKLCAILTYTAYEASSDLAFKRGPFKLFDRDSYLDSEFIKTLPSYIKVKIGLNGIRNSHLISYAPCGTISQTAWNVSSGVEPIFYHSVSRDVFMKDGKEKVTLNDFAYRHHGFKGKTLDECSVDDHMNVAETIQRYTDSAISKTVNVAANCSYSDYEQIYFKAYEMGLKGITVFRPTELRGAVIVKAEPTEKLEQESLPFFNEDVVSSDGYGSCANGICTM